MLIRGLEGWDTYGLDADLFEQDAHILILNTLHAAEHTLSSNVDKTVADIKAGIAKYGGNQRFDDDYVDALSTYSEQIRFLRNNALVALVSRLQITVRKMADSATTFVPREKLDEYRKGRFGKKGEWPLLLNEFEKRFGIDFYSEAGLVDFITPLVAARNRIVHHGGEPFNMADDGTLIESTADGYREYVKGEGFNATVEVSEELLERTVAESARLVQFLAQRLRSLELASFRESEDVQ
jgi:hypothetical protein